MRANVRTTLVYLLVIHILLVTTSPAYKHELKRACLAVGTLLNKSSFGYLAFDASALYKLQPTAAWRQQPRSGLYSSTDLLHSLQQHMLLNTSQGLYTATDLVAYMSASDVIKGQGWPARATLFMQLMAPRYTLLPARNAVLEPHMKMFSLAAADLPAVGPVAKTEDPRVGYRLFCSSPAMQYSLGPQPAVTCKVWSPVTTAKPPDHLAATAASASLPDSSPAAATRAGADLPNAVTAHGIAGPAVTSGMMNMAAAAVGAAAATGCGTCPAAWGLYASLRGSSGSCCARRPAIHRRPPQMSMASAKPIATWTVLPTGVEASTNQHTEEFPLLNNPSLSASHAPGSLLALLYMFDEWLIFPRTPLLKLLPAMSGMQQLLYAYTVLMYSWGDLLYLVTTVQRLQLRSTAAFLPGHRWAIPTAVCSVVLQMLIIVFARLAVTATLSVTALILLNQVLRFVKLTASFIQSPTLKSLGFLLWVRGRFGWGWLVAVSTAMAAAGGGVMSAIAGRGALPTAALAGAAVLVTAALQGPLCRLSVRLAFPEASNAAAAAAAAAATAAQIEVALAAQVAAGTLDSTAAAAMVMRQLVKPLYSHLLKLHYLCEDLVLLTAAGLVWELTDVAFDFVWRVLAQWSLEVSITLEASAAALAMLLQGASWQAAYGRFRQVHQVQLEQRRAEAAGDGRQNRVQAQVILQAPGDIGQAAEALRNLADELENLAHQNLGFMAALGGLGNLLYPNSSRRRARVQMLGEHWPVPLSIPFDSEEVQSELGVEVPRGFICPITQDIMQLPALLISSSVAVPATYDRDAISRWLEHSRLDPKSRQPLASDAQLVPNMDLYRAIEDWVTEKQEHRAQKQQLQRQPAGGHPGASSAGTSALQADPGTAAGASPRDSALAAAAGVGVRRRPRAAAVAAAAATAAAAAATSRHVAEDWSDSEQDPDFSASDVSNENESSQEGDSDFITSEDATEGLLTDNEDADP